MKINQFLDKAIIFHQKNDFEKARSIYQEILEFDSNCILAHHLLGILYYQIGRSAVAIDLLKKTTRLNPTDPVVFNDLGVVHQKIGELDSAQKYFKKAISIDHGYVSAYVNLADLLVTQGKFKKAVVYLIKAKHINPNDTHTNDSLREAYIKLGIFFQSEGEFKEALLNFKKATDIDPSCARSHYHIGSIYLIKSNFSKSMEHLCKSIQSNPSYPQAHYRLGMLLLLQGNLAEGWKKYEWRLQLSESQAFMSLLNPLSKPLWDGSNIDGKILLVYSEQGVGDTIQFIRFLPLILQMNVKVIFVYHPLLKSIIESIFVEKNLTCISGEKDMFVPKFDYLLPLMSLPYILGLSQLHQIPNQVPYINLPSLTNKQGHNNKVQVGLIWAGNSKHENDRYRSMNLSQFLPLFDVLNCDFHSLQFGNPANELDTINTKYSISDIGRTVNDFLDTASAINKLDLVISVDTSVAHLAGAMGKPVFLLLPKSPDWRWLINKDKTPWYPTMKLFRQKTLGQWNETLKEVKSELTIFSISNFKNIC